MDDVRVVFNIGEDICIPKRRERIQQVENNEIKHWGSKIIYYKVLGSKPPLNLKETESPIVF